MIEGGYKTSRNRHQLAGQVAKAAEPLLDHLDQSLQMSILAAVETVVSELLGFQPGMPRQLNKGQYAMPARTKEEILADPAAVRQIKKEHMEKFGKKLDVPW